METLLVVLVVLNLLLSVGLLVVVVLCWRRGGGSDAADAAQGVSEAGRGDRVPRAGLPVVGVHEDAVAARWREWRAGDGGHDEVTPPG